MFEMKQKVKLSFKYVDGTNLTGYVIGMSLEDKETYLGPIDIETALYNKSSEYYLLLIPNHLTGKLSQKWINWRELEAINDV